MITFRTLPRNTDFTTLEDVKQTLVITDNDDDAFLSASIERATDEIIQLTQRDFARAAITEELASVGRRRMILKYTPVLLIEDARLRGVPVDDIADIKISNGGAGIVSREEIFESTKGIRAGLTIQPVNYEDLDDWSFDYTGGFLMPGDNITGDMTISASAVDDSFNITGIFPLLVAGDFIVTTGFTDAGLNGTFKVVSRTDTKVIVTATLPTEAAGNAINITVETLPKALQQIAIEMVTGIFSARMRPQDIKAEKLGDHSTTYKTNDEILSSSSAQSLKRWVRMI